MTFHLRIYKVITKIDLIDCVMMVVRIEAEDGLFPVSSGLIFVSVSHDSAVVFAVQAELSSNQQVVVGYFATDALDPFTEARVSCAVGGLELAVIDVPDIKKIIEPDLFDPGTIPNATTQWLSKLPKNG